MSNSVKFYLRKYDIGHKNRIALKGWSFFTHTHTHSQAAIFFKKGVGFTALLFFDLVYVLNEHLSLIKLASSKKSLNSYYKGLKKIDSYLVLSAELLGSPVLVLFLLCWVSWALLYWFLYVRSPVLSCVLLLDLKYKILNFNHNFDKFGKKFKKINLQLF